MNTSTRQTDNLHWKSCFFTTAYKIALPRFRVHPFHSRHWFRFLGILLLNLRRRQAAAAGWRQVRIYKAAQGCAWNSSLLLFLKALQTLKLWSHQVIQKSWLSAALGRCLVGSCLQGQEPAWTEKPQRSPYFLFATDSKGLFVAHVQITPEVAVLSKSWRVSGRARTIIRRCLRCLRVLRRNTGR